MPKRLVDQQAKTVVKIAYQSQFKSNKVCFLCKWDSDAEKFLCQVHLNRISKICSPKANYIDKGIATILAVGKVNLRNQKAQKLAKALVGPPSTLLRKLELAISENKRLKQQLLPQRAESTQYERSNANETTVNSYQKNRKNLNFENQNSSAKFESNERQQTIKIDDQINGHQDYALMKKFLKHPGVQNDLDCLLTISHKALLPIRPNDMFEALDRVFCDGVEFKVSGVFKNDVVKSSYILKNDIEGSLNDIMIKNLLVSYRNGATLLWLTITPETSGLTPRLLIQLRHAVQAISEHANQFWLKDERQTYDVSINKIDVALNLQGSFIPSNKEMAFCMIKNLIQGSLDSLFSSESSNFLSLNQVSGLKVTNGENCLDTCFQYCIKDEDGTKLLNLKFYDKILDLLSREGCFVVGSRVNEVIGAKNHLSTFNKRISRAKLHGMTRIELSICAGALDKFDPFQPSVRTQWHTKVQQALHNIHIHILNNITISQLVYKKLDITKLVCLLIQTKQNILIVGRSNSWVINARAIGKNQFIGTRCAVGFTKKASNRDMWRKLETFVIKYASPGSTTKVYCLHLGDSSQRCVSQFTKSLNAPVQTPSCNKFGCNGIKLPSFIQNPIPTQSILTQWLQGWNACIDAISASIRSSCVRKDLDCLKQDCPQLSKVMGIVEDDDSSIQNEGILGVYANFDDESI